MLNRYLFLKVFVLFVLISAESETYCQVISLRCNVYGDSITSLTNYSIKNYYEDSSCTLVPAIHVVIIDTVSFTPVGTSFDTLNNENQFGNYNNDSNCFNRVQYYFTFRQDSKQELDSLESLFKNKLTNGRLVLFYSWRYIDVNLVNQSNPNLFSVFNSVGASSLASIPYNHPFIVLFQKGEPSATQEVNGVSINDVISFTRTFIIQSSSAIEQVSEAFFSCTPNPTRSILTLTFPEQVQTGEIRILDITGRIILTKNLLNENKTEFSVAEFLDGLYTIQLITPDTTSNQKFVKQ